MPAHWCAEPGLGISGFRALCAKDGFSSLVYGAGSRGLLAKEPRVSLGCSLPADVLTGSERQAVGLW